MASNIYPSGIQRLIRDGASTLSPRIALLRSDIASYAFGETHVFFDNAANDTTDPSWCEATGITNYVASGSGVALGVHATYADDRIQLKITPTGLTWASLGGAANGTINWALLYHNTGNPTTSPLLAAFDITDTPTNGSDFTLVFSPTGNIQLSYTIA